MGLLIDLIVVLAVFGLVIMAHAWQRRVDQKERATDRGFEVKINTGQSPVADRKDNDHG
jgi:hypothetical protein